MLFLIKIINPGYSGKNKMEKHTEEKPKKTKPSSNKTSIFLVAIFLLLFLGSYAYSIQKKATPQKEAAIKENTEKFIKENLIQPGTDFKVTEFVKEGDLYKLTASVGGQNITAYVSKDGKKLFPSVIDLDKSAGNAPATDAPQAAAEATQKKDVPDVELFVMSYCPYGIQAEKGILPVVQTLGSKINFSVKFVDYILHGKKEFDENLNQYCIQKEEPKEFNEYLACFAKEGDAVKCAADIILDGAKIASCVSATDKQFKLTESFNAGGQSAPFSIQTDLNKKYGVKGSPTLVVNGQALDAGRDSANLLKTICSGFTTAPPECSQALSATTPAPGFGEGTTPAANASGGAPSCH